MQKQSVNEVLANNSNHTPAQIVRITAEHYARMAEIICAEIQSHPSTVCNSFKNIEFEFNGYGIFGYTPYYPEQVIRTWVECYTLDEEGEVLANNFRIDTLMAYIDELTQEEARSQYYPEFC